MGKMAKSHLNRLKKSPLEECTSTFLRNPDKVKQWLLLADKYMQAYKEDKNSFILPKAHEFLEPLVMGFHSNLDGFLQYLTELRDRYDRGSQQFEEAQSVYRRLNGRFVQQHRRQRMSRAVAKAEELYGEISYPARIQWMADLEHAWAQRRLAFLEAQRARIKQERLDTELRTEYLLEFWDIIDTEIHKGEVPPWN